MALCGLVMFILGDDQRQSCLEEVEPLADGMEVYDQDSHFEKPEVALTIFILEFRIRQSRQQGPI